MLPKNQNGPKKGQFLGHPMWPNYIVAEHNGQAEKEGATFASRDTSKKPQEHCQLIWHLNEAA